MLVACDPGALDLTGRRCDAARPCGDGWTCFAGACEREGTEHDAGVSDAGRPDAGVDAGELDGGFDASVDAGVDAGSIPFLVNLLANPGFESARSDGGVDAWRASPGLLVSEGPPRSGQRCARLESTAAQQNPVLLPLASTPGTELGMVFCARAWVRTDTDAGYDVTLSIRERMPDGGVQSSAGMRATARGAWRELRDDHAAFGGGELDLRVVVSTRVDAGDGVYVDDVTLFRSTGVCP